MWPLPTTQTLHLSTDESLIIRLRSIEAEGIRYFIGWERPPDVVRSRKGRSKTKGERGTGYARLRGSARQAEFESAVQEKILDICKNAGYSYLFYMNNWGCDMATTSLSLGEHWEVFIKNEVASGRYGSASEVIRDALRHMEERNSKLAALRAHLAEGEERARKGEFVKDYSLEGLLTELDQEG